MSKRLYLYCMIDEATNSYDYEDEATCTNEIEVAYGWIEAGCKQVAILDALSYEYLGYMDIEDTPTFKNYCDDMYDLYYEN